MLLHGFGINFHKKQLGGDILFKKFSLLMYLLILILILSSCGVNERTKLDNNLRNIIMDYSSDENNPHIIYKNEKYVKNDCFYIYSLKDFENSEDILLSWHGKRWGYINTYYSYTADSPLFIYESRLVDLYLSQNYDYMSDIFVVENTQIEMVFSNIFEDFTNYINMSFDNFETIKLYSKKCNRLQTDLKISFLNGDYYCSFFSSNKAWKCSEYFVEQIIQNELI